MRRIRILFHAGLAVALTMLLIATWGLVVNKHLLNVDLLLGYIVAGVVHVLSLGMLGSGVSAASRPSVANWLYTAGFVHTLIALGTAIATAGTTLASGGPLSLATLAPVLAPMGAAVIPHALGVWIGHTFESQRLDAMSTIEESIIKKLADDADETRGVLKELYASREKLLKAELASLQSQGRLWQEANVDLAKLLQQARDDIGRTLESARGQLGEVGSAAKTLATDLKQPLSRVTKVLETLALDSQKASDASATLRKAVEASAADASALKGALRDAIAVVGDLQKLQSSIVELLEAELFKPQR